MFTARYHFRIAFFVFEPDNGRRAVPDAESVLLAFIFIDNQQTPLPERFEQAIDRVAMRIGAKDADAYLAEWRKVEMGEIDGDPAEIASAEEVTIEPAALELIASQGTGALRDAISLLDQLTSYGDEITLDYATFYEDRMPAFECECGSPGCRGTIRGSDHLADFVERYGDHVSDYVRRKRAARR